MQILKKIRNLTRALSRLEAIEAEVRKNSRILDFAFSSPEQNWLYINKTERMDANLEFFDKKRRDFHLARYHFAAGFVKGPQIADIACGTGYGTGYLSKLGLAAKVTGIDIDAEAIQYAKRVYRSPNNEFLCLSGTDTRLPAGSFDSIVSFETIEHVPDDVELIDEFHRLLKPGGTLVISTPNLWPLALAPYHVREYDLDSFSKILNRRFVIDSIHNQNSGSEWDFNRKQPPGIVPTSETNAKLAECYVAVCHRV